MALTPNFSVAPPPQLAHLEKVDGQIQWTPNPQFFQWINLLWKWSTTLGNNADGAASFSGSIAIGTSPNWFKADANGIYLGGATFAASPFRVSMVGALTATSGTFSGDVSTSGVLTGTGSNAVGGYNAAVIGDTASGTTGGFFRAANGIGVIGIAGGNWYATVGSSSGSGSSGGVSGIANAAGDIGVNASNAAGGVALNIASGHFKYSGVTSTGVTGTGKLVFDTGPVIGKVTYTANSDIYESATNGNAALNFNYVGYNGGTTQFRDINVYDGKNASVLALTGSTKAAAFGGAVTPVNNGTQNLGGSSNYWASLYSTAATHGLMNLYNTTVTNSSTGYGSISEHATHNLAAAAYKGGSVPATGTAPFMYFNVDGKVCLFIDTLGAATAC